MNIFNFIFWGRSATGYDFQIGKFYGSWCNLYGGYWKHWWQPSRFHFNIDREFKWEGFKKND